MTRPDTSDQHAHAAGRHAGSAEGAQPARHRRPRPLRRLGAMAGAAALVTGLTVATGVAAQTSPGAPLSADLGAVGSTLSPEALEELAASRDGNVSRSDRRDAVDPTKAQRLSAGATSGGQVARTEQVAVEEPAPAPVSGDPRAIAQAMLPEFGFSADQFSCLDSLWTKESNWDHTAANPTSSAYGIPQALPGSKMASAGADWATNPATQIRWGLGYIAEVYGSPCAAWSHSQANNWY